MWLGRGLVLREKVAGPDQTGVPHLRFSREPGAASPKLPGTGPCLHIQAPDSLRPGRYSAETGRRWPEVAVIAETQTVTSLWGQRTWVGPSPLAVGETKEGP